MQNSTLKPFVLALGLLTLSACGVTTGKKEVALDPFPQAERTYRLTESDVKVPLPHLFLSQSGDMLAQYFGMPDLVRKEGEAEARQYRTEAPFGTCVLLAVLYEGRGLEPRIDHLSVRENGRKASDPIHCLRELAFANTPGK